MSLSSPQPISMFAAAKPGVGSSAQHGALQMRETGRVLWRGKPVAVTATEFKMLRLLTRQPGLSISYRELYDLVHGPGFMAGKGNAGYRANVRAFIKRIRKKFRDVDDRFDAIVNHPGTGYCWVEAG